MYTSHRQSIYLIVLVLAFYSSVVVMFRLRLTRFDRRVGICTNSGIGIHINRHCKVSATTAINTLLCSKLHRLSISRLYASSTGGNGTIVSELKEGLEVEFITGGRGYLVEKGKGGWWKVLIRGKTVEEDRIISVRTSGFNAVIDIIDSRHATTTGKITTNNSPYTAANSPLQASEDDTIGPQLSSLGLVEDASFNIEDESVARFHLQEIIPPKLHASMRKWIVFSDLHVKSTSIESCEQVLHQVHEAAVARNAGIMFLGDFWHVRGSLDVELLNRVLKALGTWVQPVIMIPGNHDQVTLGGAVHAIEPLKYAFKSDQILMLSEPVVCMNALWIPYRRDHNLMKSILKAGSDSRDDVKIIFCHADVNGAYMNDNMRSKEGLQIGIFPPNLPIYSGHFHKPHTMTKGRSSIRYVGSPYQTSLSEAGQEKYLYCLDCNYSEVTKKYSWKEIEMWTLDIGRKYYRALSLKDPVLDVARPGDRVVLPVRVGEDVEAEKLLQAMKLRGIEVEIRREANVRIMEQFNKNSTDASRKIVDDNIVSAADTSSSSSGSKVVAGEISVEPLSLFMQFMSASAQVNDTSASSGSVVGDGVKAEQLHAAVLLEGRNTLERLISTSSDKAMSGKVNELNLKKVSLLNFGPYGQDWVHYPLSKRGLTLIRGKSSDGTGADSNGSGKTTLAMSVMWGLTGSMDTRLVADGKAVDVAFDTGSSSSNKHAAEVIIDGIINSTPFTVTRRRGVRKNELLFVVDNQDLTTQSVKDTQAIIDDMLGIRDGLLQRCCFFGQHSHTLQSLLGLGDVKLKSELASLVDTKIWSVAVQDVRSREKADKARAVELGVEIRVRSEEIQRTRASLYDAMQLVRRLESDLEVAKQNAIIESGRSKSMVASKYGNVSLPQLNNDLSQIQRNITMLQRDSLDPLRKSVVESLKETAQSLLGFDRPIATCNERIARLGAALNASAAAKSALMTKISQLNQNHTSLLNNLNASIQSLNNGSNSSTSNGRIVDLNSFSSSDIDALRKDHENSLASAASINVRLSTTETSLSRLKELTEKTIPAMSVAGITACHTHHRDNCPTCGQEMPVETQKQRLVDLGKELDVLQGDKSRMAAHINVLRSRVDEGMKIKGGMDQLKQLKDRIVEMQEEFQVHDSSISAKSLEIKSHEIELKSKMAEKKAFEQSQFILEQQRTISLRKVEATLSDLLEQEKQLRTKIDDIRMYQSELMSNQSQVNNRISLIEDRLSNSRDALKVQSEPLFLLEKIISDADREKESIVSRAAVLDRLAECLGPRGIQHYVFIGILRQLEQIANAYLDILADGGIRLGLQGDEDADRIVKTVLIRAAEGKYKERGLSQLSGGQWRRVSMALDFAFAETIRRKGTLRSNLMVMDEVLTHLDASGREAVGTVLRAMVDGPCITDSANSSGGVKHRDDELIVTDGKGVELVDIVNDTESKSKKISSVDGDIRQMLLGGGSYETVIVILQDLSAVELEEAFDHIDTVVKDGDTSRVIIDGITSK